VIYSVYLTPYALSIDASRCGIDGRKKLSEMSEHRERKGERDRRKEGKNTAKCEGSTFGLQHHDSRVIPRHGADDTP